MGIESTEDAGTSLAAKVVRSLKLHGLGMTVSIVASVVEDLHLRIFDRCHGVRTSGHIPLATTSLDHAKASRGHRYRAVNAWAFKRFLNRLEPDRKLRFVDLGCGLGRACLIAADYGFSRVRGVDLVPEFCAQARKNAQIYRRPRCATNRIEILEQDAVDYSRNFDDDLVFLYNPFPADVLREVVENIVQAARASGRPVLIVYSERVVESSKTREVLERQEFLTPILETRSWGQAFHVFELKSDRMAA